MTSAMLVPALRNNQNQASIFIPFKRLTMPYVIYRRDRRRSPPSLSMFSALVGSILVVHCHEYLRHRSQCPPSHSPPSQVSMSSVTLSQSSTPPGFRAPHCCCYDTVMPLLLRSFCMSPPFLSFSFGVQSLTVLLCLFWFDLFACHPPCCCLECGQPLL